MSKAKTKTKKQEETKPGQRISQDKNKINSLLEKKSFQILLALMALIAFWVYKDFLTFKNLLIYKDIGSDTYNLFNPLLVHFSNYLRTEGIPKWSFNQGMGQNVFPGGINDPFNIFLYLFGASQISYMIVYAQVIKIMLGGIIFYHYLKTIGITSYASLVGALLFSFCGYMILGGGWYGHSSFVVYGAFLLFAFEKLYKQKSWIYFPIAVAILTGDLFTTYIFSAFLLLYTLLRFYQENSFKNASIVPLLLKMVGLGLLGIAINAVFLISPLLQMIYSPRFSGESGLFNTLKAAPAFGLAETNEIASAIMRTFSSDLIGTGSNYNGWKNYLESPIFYAGLINMLLIPQLFQFLDKKRKILFGIFLGIWVFLVMFPYFRHCLYFFTGDYYKVGMSFFVPITILFTGISALSYIDRLNKINIKVLLGTFIVLVILLFFPYLSSDQKLVEDGVRNFVIVFLILYTAIIYLLSLTNYKAFAKILLLLFLVVELGYFASLTVNKRSILSSRELNQKIGFNDYTIESVQYLKSIDKSFFRIDKNYLSGNAVHGSLNDALIQDYYSTPSYQSFNQLYYIKFLNDAGVIDGNNETQTRWSMGLLNQPLLQTFANVKYSLTKETGGFYGRNDSLTTIGDVVVFKNKYYLPFGYTYNHFILKNDFKNISKLQKDKSLFQSFVIDENQKEKFNGFVPYELKDTVASFSFDEYGKYVNDLRKDTLAVSEHSQNLFKGKITLAEKKLLFFSIPFDDGWHATVDGKAVELQLVNIGFFGLILDKGMHAVELKFEPPYVKQSLWVSVAGLLIYFAGIVWWYLAKKKQKVVTTSV